MYDKNYKYGLAAQVLDERTIDALKPLFDQYVEAGHSPREISQIMQSCVNMLELEAILQNDQDKVVK